MRDVPVHVLDIVSQFDNSVWPIQFGRMTKDAILFVSLRQRGGITLRLSVVHNKEMIDYDRHVRWDDLTGSVAGPGWVVRETVRYMKEKMHRALLVH